MDQSELKSICEALDIDRVYARSNGQVTGCCPFHSETRPSWGITSRHEAHLWNCFGCGEKGTLLTLVMRLKSMTVRDAQRYIKTFGAYDGFNENNCLARIVHGKQTVEYEEVPFYMLAPYVTKTNCRLAQKKLAVRTRPLFVAKSAVKPGYDPEQMRVLYPWYDLNGRLRGCTGHYVGRDEFVYKNARAVPYFGLKKGLWLFNPFQTSRLEKARELIVVEGESDAHKIASALEDWSSDYAVVALGHSNISSHQKRAIAEIGLPLIAWGDNDNAGNRLKESLCDLAEEHGLSCRSEFKHYSKDAGGTSSAQIKHILSCAQTAPLV